MELSASQAPSERPLVVRRWLSWGTLRSRFCTRGKPMFSSASRACDLLKSWSLPDEGSHPRRGSAERALSVPWLLPSPELSRERDPLQRAAPLLQPPEPRAGFPCRARLPHAFLLVLAGKERRQVLGEARPRPRSHEGSPALASLDRVLFPSSLCPEREADNVLQRGGRNALCHADNPSWSCARYEMFIPLPTSRHPGKSLPRLSLTY